ncbi:MAG: response regulator [Akkermansiaceae bacterium]|nr:response regulator [Akkermansiaceae bacterium]
MNSTLLEPQQKQNNELDSVEILLVEDNENDATLTIRALKKRNLANNLIHVSDGQQALDFLFAKDEYSGRDPLHLPKVVLLDLKLPKVSGLEVLRQLKANEKTKIVPVVMLSSSQEESDLIESYKMGANSYIVKPVEFDNFSEAISDMGLYWLVLNKRPKSF